MAELPFNVKLPARRERKHKKHRRTPPPRSRFLGLIALVVVLGAGVGLAIRLIRPNAAPGSYTPKIISPKHATTTTATATISSTQRPTSTSAPTTTSNPRTSTTSAVGSTTTSTTSTTTTSTTTTTTTPVAIAPSQIILDVFNGDGASGVATAAAAEFKSVGFQVFGTNNATSYSYVETVIQYAPGDLAEAETVAKWVTGGTKLVQISGPLQTNEVNVVLGSQFHGLS